MSLKSISREGGGYFSWGGEVLETWPSLSVIESVKARMCEPVWVHWAGTVFVVVEIPKRFPLSGIRPLSNPAQISITKITNSKEIILYPFREINSK